MNRNDSIPPVGPQAAAPRDPLQPDPRFAEFLEWQLASELRRATRFGGVGTPSEPAATRDAFAPSAIVVAPRPRLGRFVRAAAVLLGALALGACGAIAVQEAEREAEQREQGRLLAEQYAVRLELATMREAQAKAELERQAQQTVAGVRSEEESADAAARFGAIRLARQLAEIDAAEVAATGREPDRRLGAARVSDRDLVDERLALEQFAHRLEEGHILARYKQAELLHARGLAPVAQVEQASAAIVVANASRHSLDHRRETRRRFLAGDFDALAAEIAGLRAIAEAERSTAEVLLKVATTQRDRLALLHQRGRIPMAELSAAEQTVADAKARFELAELELAALAQRRG